MALKFLGVHFHVRPKNPGTDILLAELSQLPFDSFEETDSGLSAYIDSELWKEQLLDKVEILQNASFQIDYTVESIPVTNWNETWEQQFSPITVDAKLHIRAPFHPSGDYPLEIVIMPKMSFGTGHHETTFLMSKMLLSQNLSNQKVLDMGSGTAILAILSEKLGATDIDAIDIDPWCFENANENIQLNQSRHIVVHQGDAKLLGNKSYHVIIANINRNILLQDMPAYCKVLELGGRLFLSGFYDDDFPMIDKCASSLGLQFHEKQIKNRWVGASWIKA